MKLIISLICATVIYSCNVSHKLSDNSRFNTQLKDVLTKSVSQYKYFATTIPDTLFPKTFQNNKLITCKSSDWVSGFYPGTLLYLSDIKDDTVFYNLAKDKLRVLKKEQFNKNTHDLGFMMYCSFGNALKIRPDKEYEEVLLNSAKSLASRYNPVVGAIRSWNSGSQDFLVIIDNMMNLELLFWATRVSGDSTFYKIATSHANTTLKNHFREDFSSYHVVNYNPVNGSVKEKKTHQGANDESSWARGQAWALYGYTMMYKETGDSIYLDLANKIASYILKHPSIPEDKVPLWDFNASPETSNYRDASAGAIFASALIDLSVYSPSKRGEYMTWVKQILTSLSSPAYLANYKTNGGFLLMHSVGHLPNNSEVDVPLTYADYYYIEAISRYLKYYKK